jgi:hypothetical protein
MTWERLSLALALRSVMHPTLALDLVRVAWRFRAREWYRRAPFLPLPDATYLKWRMYTAYGDFDAVPSPEEVERYVRWAATTTET